MNDGVVFGERGVVTIDLLYKLFAKLHYFWLNQVGEAKCEAVEHFAQQIARSGCAFEAVPIRPRDGVEHG